MKLSNFVLFFLSIVFSLFLAELVLKFRGIKRFQTWLEMEDLGYAKNRSNFMAWDETFDPPVLYRFDSNGNRMEEHLTTKPDSAKKVLLLGDSFTFGLYLPDSLTISARLNKETEYNVINGGVGGSGTADHLFLLHDFFEKQSTDVVLLLLNYDDVDRVIAKNLFVLKKDSLISSQRWKPNRVYYFFSGKSWHTFLERHSFLYAFLSKLFWKHFFFYDDYQQNQDVRKYEWPQNADLYPDSGYSTRLWLHLILRMQQVATEHDARFIVVTTGYLPDKEKNPHSEFVYEKLNTILPQNEIKFWDLRPFFEQEIGTDWKSVQTWPDSHPNGKGTLIMSRAIVQKLGEMEH